MSGILFDGLDVLSAVTSKVYAGLTSAAGSFPVAERSAQEILSLSMLPALSREQQGRIAAWAAELVPEKEAHVLLRGDGR